VGIGSNFKRALCLSGADGTFLSTSPNAEVECYLVEGKAALGFAFQICLVLVLVLYFSWPL
jgi:hypothetical protein